MTAAFAAAADFELPLTLRGVSSSMVFTTGHDPSRAARCRTGRSSRISGATVAVYMGRSVGGGRRLAADRGRAVARYGGRRRRERQPRQAAGVSTARWPTFRRSKAARDLTGPVMTIIGDAVAGANFEHSEPLAAQAGSGGCDAGRREPTHEGADRKQADRRRSRVALPTAPGSSRSAWPISSATRTARRGWRRSARPPTTTTRWSTST